MFIKYILIVLIKIYSLKDQFTLDLKQGISFVLALENKITNQFAIKCCWLLLINLLHTAKCN